VLRCSLIDGFFRCWVFSIAGFYIVDRRLRHGCRESQAWTVLLGFVRGVSTQARFNTQVCHFKRKVLLQHSSVLSILKRSLSITTLLERSLNTPSFSSIGRDWIVLDEAVRFEHISFVTITSKEHLICTVCASKHLICYHHQWRTSHLYRLRESTSHSFHGHDVNISFDPSKDENISSDQATSQMFPITVWASHISVSLSILDISLVHFFKKAFVLKW
jgi:hypothetical protein